MRKTWLSGQVRAEKVLAEAVTIDGRRSGFVSSAQRPTSGRGGHADDATLTSRQDSKGSTDRQCRRKPGTRHRQDELHGWT